LPIKINQIHLVVPLLVLHISARSFNAIRRVVSAFTILNVWKGTTIKDLKTLNALCMNVGHARTREGK
jgi:hypothetical protein